MGMRGLGRTHTNKDRHALPETPHSNDFLLFSSFPNFSCLIDWFHDHFNWLLVLLILCTCCSSFQEHRSPFYVYERSGLANENIYVNSTLIQSYSLIYHIESENYKLQLILKSGLIDEPTQLGPQQLRYITFLRDSSDCFTLSFPSLLETKAEDEEESLV